MSAVRRHAGKRLGRRRALATSVAITLASCVALARPAGAEPAVFAGDAVAPSGEPWVMLPGAPLVDWGPDETWGTGDDRVDPSLRGDVDLVVRTVRGFSVAPGPIAPPADGLRKAPRVVAGGRNLLAHGKRLRFAFVVSDGAMPGAGNALLTDDLDGQGVFVVAYADLDGDGVLGPTASDPAGSADDALEAQEALTLAGRRLAVLEGGVASGALAVSLGLPRSRGGLGIVLAGGATTGALPPVPVAGPWIATLLPALWPIDPARIVGENPRPADPRALVDVEVELERMFRPAPGHPLVGTPFAIPLDGSSASNDLARAISGPVESVTIARALVPEGFAADPGRAVRPAVAADGTRLVVEPIDSVALADDGPGSAVALLAFPADALGNQADPATGGSTVGLAVSPNLRIVAPDTDGDPLREDIAFGAAGIAAIALDDAGGALDGGASGHLVATLDGATAAAVRVHLGSGPPPGGNLTGDVDLRFEGTTGRDQLDVGASFDGDLAGLDLASRPLRIAVREPGGAAVYDRTFPAGALAPGAAGLAHRLQDPAGTEVARVQRLVVRPGPAAPGPRLEIALSVRRLDLGAVDRDVEALTLVVSSDAFESSAVLPCEVRDGGARLRCRP